MELFLNVALSRKQLNDDKDIRANPVSGICLTQNRELTLLSVRLKAFTVEETRPESTYACMSGEVILPEKNQQW